MGFGMVRRGRGCGPVGWAGVCERATSGSNSKSKCVAVCKCVGCKGYVVNASATARWRW